VILTAFEGIYKPKVLIRMAVKMFGLDMLVIFLAFNQSTITIKQVIEQLEILLLRDIGV